MAELVWDAVGERMYETGVNHGVLFVMNEQTGVYTAGVPWNGLISVSEKPSGAEPSPLYADNIKYLTLIGPEDFAATVEAYTYPEAFAECDGSYETADGVFIGQQHRKKFGLVYKTILGNDVAGNELGYKLHIIYGALAAPSEKAFSTINDSPEAITFSWEISTSPVEVSGYLPTAMLIVDSTKADPTKLALLEDELFGTYLVDSNLPTPDEIITMLTVP
jgi:hypothetical protein